MRIAFIEVAGLTNDLLRAVAGAHPLCVGYPDGVPESWRDDSADVSPAQRVPEMPGKHPKCETRPGGKPGGESNSIIGGLARLQLLRLEFESSRHARIRNVSAAPVLEMRDDDKPQDWPDERSDDEC